MCWQPVVAPPWINGENGGTKRRFRADSAESKPTRKSPNSFQASQVIPPSSKPPDETWKMVHAKRRRAFHRRHNLDKASSRFLESRLFLWFRWLLGLALLGTVGFTVVFMKLHSWRPWWNKEPESVAPHNYPEAMSPSAGGEPLPAIAPFPAQPQTSIETDELAPLGQ